MVFNAAHPFTFLFSNSSSHPLLSLARRLTHSHPLPASHLPPPYSDSRFPTRCDAESGGMPAGEIEFNLEMNIESNERRDGQTPAELRPSLSTVLFIGLTNQPRPCTLAIPTSITTPGPPSLELVRSISSRAVEARSSNSQTL